MKRIIVIDNQWEMDSPVLKYALKASKAADTEIIGILPASTTDRAQVNKLMKLLNSATEILASEGVTCSSYVVGTDAEEFISKLKGFMPASLILAGDSALSVLKKNGITLELLKKEFACPVTTARALESVPEKNGKDINWGMFVVYAIGSLIMYGIFFPKIVTLNERLFMTMTINGAAAIIAVVVIHAWVWGNTVHILPKMFKLEK
ncbi:MAG: hypothetical protein HQK97_00525 [Nitrospirae bacterium]|nr:hypothetical protein [Nitrospirota bacterium]